MFVLALIEHDRRKIISTDANLDAVNVKIEVLDKSSAQSLFQLLYQGISSNQ